MPYRFSFRSTAAAAAPAVAFSCPLQCTRCVATSASTAARCKNTSCIGTPYCWQHLLGERHLQVRPSGLPGAGKGLFAQLPRGRGRQQAAAAAGGRPPVVFTRDEIIIDYDGEPVTRAQIDQRYGEFTAPYALHVSAAAYENAACRRGVGSLANHVPTRRANARLSFRRPASGPPVGVLRATKAIRSGDEILVNYGGDYGMDEHATHSTTRRR